MINLISQNKPHKNLVSTYDDIVITVEDQNNFPHFAKLCSLITKASQIAFSVYIRQASSAHKKYTEWLQQPEIHLSLRRLKCRGFFTDSQWNLLFPKNKSKLNESSALPNFPSDDLSLLILLLKYTGILSVPEPGGWLNKPESFDQTAGAQLVRLQLIRRQIASLKRLNDDIFTDISFKIKTILVYFGGLEVEEYFDNVDYENLSENDQLEAYNSFIIWHKQEEQIMQIENRVEDARGNSHNEIPALQTSADGSSLYNSGGNVGNFKRGLGSRLTPANSSFAESSLTSTGGLKWVDVKNGIPEEEKCILREFYKRLVTEVRPDSMIDQLLSKKILNIEESGEVFNSLQSTEQMKILLDILVTKSGHAFTEFLLALKTRYHELYQQINEAYQLKKQEILANKPEGVSYCHNYQLDFYQRKYSNWVPILWYPDATIPLDKFYCSLQLLDRYGNQVDPLTILSQKTQKRFPRVYVIEGDPGTGKTYLSHLLAAKWAQDPSILNSTSSFRSEKHAENPHNEVNDTQIQLVFHLDLKITSPNLKWMLFDQLFDSTMKLTEREVWEVIDKHQEICCFILDGYSDNLNDDLLNLIKGKIFPHCRVIIFSSSSCTNLLNKYYQEKLVLTGFKPGESLAFTKKYIKLTKRPVEQFENILMKLSRSSETYNQEIADFNESKESTMSTIMEDPNESQSRMDPSRQSMETTSNSALPKPKENKKKSVALKIRAGSLIPGNIMGFTRPSDNVESRYGFTFNNSARDDSKEPVSLSRNNTDLGNKSLSNSEKEEKIQEKLTALRFYSQFPLYCGFFCAMIDMKMSIDLTSWSGLLEHFFTAIKMKLIEREKESRVNINRLFNQLMELAFESIKQGLSTLVVKSDSKFTKFGILCRIVSHNSAMVSITNAAGNSSNLNSSENIKLLFSNDIIQYFLAAKCLDMYGVDETNNYFQNLTINKSFYPLIVFYCGIRKNDFDTPALRTLFRKIIDLNLQILLSDHGNGLIGTMLRHSQLGSIMKFQLSLDCIAAMNGRDDLTEKVGQTLPNTLLIEHSCTIPVLTLQGLSYLINSNCKSIQQLDLRLNYLSRQTPDAFANLAQSIHENQQIKSLRIFWEQLELMSSFYATVCENNHSLETIEIFDESNHKYDNFNSKVAHNIRCGCRSMVYVKQFAFVDCTFATLTHAIIRNLGDNLISLDLSGCSFTIIACKDLADKLIKTKSLRSLVLANAKMQSMAFNTFIRCVSLNRTLTLLNLDSIKMDNVSFFSLAESLKLNNKLEQLSLKDVTINERNCDEIVQVLRATTTLKTIFFSGEKIPTSGKQELEKHAKNVKLIGLDKIIAKPKELPKTNEYIN